MHTKLIQYRVHPEAAQENEDLIRGVFAELTQRQPKDLHYSVWRAGADRFVHLVSTLSAADTPLASLESFQRFQAGVRSRCVSPPGFDEVEVVGSYAGSHER
jgi:hypothetical protein